MKVIVNFQLGKLNVKDEIINNDTSVGQRKNLSPQQESTGIELLIESDARAFQSSLKCRLFDRNRQESNSHKNSVKWPRSP